MRERLKEFGTDSEDLGVGLRRVIVLGQVARIWEQRSKA